MIGRKRDSQESRRGFGAQKSRRNDNFYPSGSDIVTKAGDEESSGQ
jgi:hypothetical protein